MTSYYDKGDDVRCSGAFTDSDGNAQDPAALVFRWIVPGSAAQAYTYGVDDELVKDSTGNYHVDLDASTAGTWYYRFEATGTGKAAAEGMFQIDAGAF